MELADDIETTEQRLTSQQVEKTFDEANVADFTISPEECGDEEPQIRLRSAIDIR